MGGNPKMNSFKFLINEQGIKELEKKIPRFNGGTT